jgi:predicted Zn-dependent protease
MFERFLTLTMIFLGGFTISASTQSCLHKERLTLKTPADAPPGLYQPNGIVVWKNLPVHVRVDTASETVYNVLRSDYEEAAAAWNATIGCTVFVVSDFPEARVTVELRPVVEEHPEWVASARYVAVKPSRSFDWHWGSEIHVYQLALGDKPHRLNVAAHELGHVLGLEDTLDDLNDLMHGYSRYGQSVDVDAVVFFRRAYCK